MASRKFDSFTELKMEYDYAGNLNENFRKSTDERGRTAVKPRKYMYIITYDLSGRHSRTNVYTSLWKVIDPLVFDSYQMSKSCYFCGLQIF